MRHSLKDPTAPKGNIKSLRTLLPYLKPYRLQLLAVVIALTITSTSVLGFGKGLQFLVDEGFGNNNPETLDKALLIMLTVTAVLAVATFARFFFITYTGEKVIADIRQDVYSHMIHLSAEFYETTKIGEILSRLTTDTTLLQEVVGSSLSIALRNILMFTGGLSLLIITSPKLAAFAAIVVPLVIIPIIFLGRKVRILSRASQDQVASISSQIEESLGAIQTVQAYTRETLEIRHFSERIHSTLQAAFKRIIMRSTLTAIVIFSVFAAIGFVLWVGGNDVMEGRMTAGELSSFVFYAIVVAGSLGALSEVVGSLQRAAGATERLFELLHTECNVQNPLHPKTLPTGIALNISFQDVTFFYPARPDHASLEHFNLTVNQGETIALVGPSGAGKSTVLKLLLRFYDPQSGTISINGLDIKQLNMQDLRDLFAIVSQDPIIFSGTALENIGYGNPDATKDEIMEAAKLANAFSFIQKLPDGFHTYLGEKGVKLSGGQKQRIAIARAILKNPHILLLDEATSALDTESETLVQEALEKLMNARTTLVIAHRLSTIQKADRIIVINDGHIEEEGSHRELVAKGGLYARLAKMQFSDTKAA